VLVARDATIPMRDGVPLAADIYLPAEGVDRVPGACPVLLLRTPYDKAGASASGMFYARRGYIFMAQDVRGRYASEGEFFPFADEGPDGVDTVAWIREQAWCNGKVGTLGGSYCAADQSALASLNPPGLTAMVVEDGPSSYYHSSMRHNGVLELRFLVYAMSMAASGREAAADPGLRRVLEQAAGHAWDYIRTGPLRAGTTPLHLVPSYERWAIEVLTRARYDEFWRSPGFGPAPYYDQHADVPTLYVGGWYDTYTRGTIENFVALSRCKERPVHLLMGPWTHGQTGVGQAGDATFRSGGGVGFESVRLRWFDQWLKGRDMGLGESDPVTYFVMGTNGGKAGASGAIDMDGEWRTGKAWPPAEGHQATFYLHGDGGLSESVPYAGQPAQTTFTFDPRSPVPTIGGNLSAMPLPAGAFDQKSDPRFPESGGNGVPLAARPDVLVYATPPLPRPLAIAGPITVELYVSTDGPDTDFTAKLVDVHPASAEHPGGLAVNLTDGIARLRFRNGYETEELAVPGEVYRLGFELFPTACVLPVGHRLRLDVSSSNYPRFELNPNTGETLGKHRTTRSAQNTVHHGAERPSAVRLWVLPSGTD